ncbi:MAG TPA: hypothetical protein VFS31_06685 [Chitinophagaceae bacterium]|nr:hypothetical protein [Chitinophagaceae bacterium]
MSHFSLNRIFSSAIFLFSYLLLFVTDSRANEAAGNITGQVITADGKPAANVTIQISDSKR